MSYISDVTINGSNSPISASLRGNCSTASATAAKAVSCSVFDTLKEGVSIFVTFTNDNTASNPTLNVNSTGAKAIKNGTSEVKWEAGQTAAFLYDGTYWQMIGGSGDIPDPLPSQAGQAGKFLTTDGTNTSWGNVDALPAQSGQNGKFLTTDGIIASWGNVDATWGSIAGNISSQTDLTEVVSPLINQWDEQWESGGIDNNGNNYNINPHIRCKGYIPVKPNTDYYAQISAPCYLKVHFYDINKSHISASLFGRSIFTTPSNAYFIRIWGYSDAYGGTYNHDISINYPSTYTGYYPSALPKEKAHIGGLGNAIAMKGWNQIIPVRLLPATQTINDVTFTNNGDGTITVNGTAAADTSLILVSEARVHVKDKGKFIYSGCPHGGSRDTYCMGFSDSVGFADIGNGHYNENYAYNYNLSIIVKSGTQCNNLVFKPNLFLLEPIFGAGNEPSSIEDFRSMFPADYYPYYPSAATLDDARVRDIYAGTSDMTPGVSTLSTGTIYIVYE